VRGELKYKPILDTRGKPSSIRLLESRKYSGGWSAKDKYVENYFKAGIDISREDAKVPRRARSAGSSRPPRKPPPAQEGQKYVIVEARKLSKMGPRQKAQERVNRAKRVENMFVKHVR